MKRTAVFITLGIILFVVGGIVIYQSAQKRETTPWDLISNESVLVIELPKLNSISQKFEGLPFLDKSISSSDYLKRIFENRIFQDHRIFISVQSLSRDDFGFLTYTETSPEAWTDEVKRISSTFTNPQIKKRIYNGVEINEITGGKSHLSFALVDNILITSESSFLLEGVLKLKTLDRGNLFKSQHPALFKLPTLKSDEGNVYLNVSRLGDFLAVFLKPGLGKNKLLLDGSALADIKIEKESVLLNGFLLSSKTGILNLFEKQKPQPMDMEGLISSKTSAVAHFGFSDPEQWLEDQAGQAGAAGTTPIDSLEQEMLSMSVDIEALRKSIGNQFANCFVDKDNPVVSILKLNKEAGRISVFDELSSKLADQKKDSLYVENYAGYQIKLIDYKNFLYQLLYPIAYPSSQAFFVEVGQYLILCESVELIKSFIDDMDNEDTWGKSVEWNRFFGTTLQESNINIFLDGKLTSVLLRDKLNDKWAPTFRRNHFMDVNKGSIQLSRLDDNYYLNVSFWFSGAFPVQNTLVKTTYNYGNKIINHPGIVKNHVSKGIEVVMQDSANNLYLLSKDLKTLWKKDIGGEIVDGIGQLDFYANGKLQLFFATAHDIHIIDRLGRYVEGFPKPIKTDGKLEYTQLVDYDKSKRYRYLFTDEKGNLVLTDKHGNLLEGWAPRRLNGRMLTSARHYRILGKDYFLAVGQNGTVNLMNRRGEMVKGFPMDLGIRPSGDISISIGSTLPSTNFTVVSKDGVKVQFGLNGQITKKEVLMKRTGSSDFSLVKSITENSYVFLRVDAEKISILDADGKDLVEIENPGSTVWRLAYLEDRLKERYYCLYDEQQNFSYYLSGDGDFLLPQPLESTQLPSLYYDDKQKGLSIYNPDNSSISLIYIER